MSGDESRQGAGRAVRLVTRDERGLIPVHVVDSVVRQIIERFHPIRIILFGSYAYGRPRHESDIDLLVIMETPLHETEQAVRILQSVEYHFGLDLIVRTPTTLAHRLRLGDPFIHEILENGKVLYERADS